MKRLKTKPSMRQIFSALVIIMWAVSFLVDLTNPKYDPPDYINPLIMLVGAYLFASTAGKKGDK